MYALMTKLVRPMRQYWPSFFFGIFLDREEFEVNKIAKHLSSGPQNRAIKTYLAGITLLTLSDDVGSMQDLKLIHIYQPSAFNSVQHLVFHVVFWRKCNGNSSNKYLTNFASVAGKSWRATAVEAIDQVDASSVVQTSKIDTVIYICRRENQRYLKKSNVLFSQGIHQTLARVKTQLVNVNLFLEVVEETCL